MNNIIKTMCFLLLAIGWTGCYEDKGNYDYAMMSKPVVKGIPEKCTAYVNSRLHIPVTVEWPNGELKNISYEWRVEGKTISTEKDLDIVVNLDVKPRQYADFSIINNETGVREMTLFTIDVTTEFSSGWIAISQESDCSEMSFIREGDNKLYKNIYETANGEKLPKGVVQVKEHWIPYGDLTGEIFVGIPTGPNYSLDLDGSSLKRVVYNKDEFLGNVPEDFAPVNMDCVTNWDYIFSNGKLFTRYVERTHDAQYHEGKFVPVAVPGNYELSPITLRGNIVSSTDIIAFDLKTKSYQLLRNGSLKNFNYEDDPNKRFNPSNMNKTLISGGATSTNAPVDKFITFLKGDDQKYYVHCFTFTGWGMKSYSSDSEKVFPDASLVKEDSQWAVCKNRPYVYFSSGKDLYAYNTTGNTVKKLEGCRFDKPIKAIAIHPLNFEQLAVAVENSSDASKCDFMILDVSYVGDGKIIDGSRQEAALGNVSKLYYKIGNQWNVF